MPGLARKVLICAAIDGLIVQPLSPKGHRPFSPLKIKYGDASISSVPRDQVPDTEISFEAFGIIGIISVSKLNYLVTITQRTQVAQVFGSPIYVVTGVAITPCSSNRDATESIKRTAQQLDDRPSSSLNQEDESSDEDVELPNDIVDEVDDGTAENAETDPSSSRSSIAEDVMRRKGSYGRFAQRWFSRGGWALDQRRVLGLSDQGSAPTSPVLPNDPARSKPPPSKEDSLLPATALLPKLLRAIQVLFGSSRSFYFSYDVDITRSLQDKAIRLATEAPLYTQVDNTFFWNRHLLAPLAEAGQDSVILPLMQGFIGQKAFVVDRSPPQVDEPAAESVELSSLSPSASTAQPNSSASTRNSLDLRPSEKKYLITLISRRSTKRAGLRYLRRGIDENGFTANMVETEQILSSPEWENSSPVYSFLQIRGSIPLFFTQTAYALKPVPTLLHSSEQNYSACKRHFELLSKSYGALQIVNLVEKHGIEEPIGSAYKKNAELVSANMGGNGIPFEWFDFHQACRGMKFENVSLLLSQLKNELEAMGSSVQKDTVVATKQSGVFRTNCMDCLDRTNVCQSSFAKHMLEVQLKQEGIDMSAQLDQETMWFNTLWADNGDAVSNQYASTAAMKGDYTRTRKRDYRGALNDLGLSVARFYSGMVNDYFSQAAIDFLLGNVTGKVFDEFEANMMTKDPAVSITKMRDGAIEQCQKRVIADVDEEIHGGWVLISPNTADALKSWPMEETVLLLTDCALYLCSFDWDLDKVSSFERVALVNITGIKFGTYITSTVSSSHMDEMRNVGFVVIYQPGKNDVRRTNTRTLSSKGDLATMASKANGVKTDGSAKRQSAFASFLSSRPKGPLTRKLAFKAPYTDSSTAATRPGLQQTEIQQVVTICAEIERLALESQIFKDGEEPKTILEKGDIISLESAKKNTGLFEQLGHSIKRLVWA